MINTNCSRDELYSSYLNVIMPTYEKAYIGNKST